MERIRNSVGRGGANHRSDVEIVQTLLNRHRPAFTPLLAVDKVAKVETITAIKEFQSRVVKLQRPDGRVDPKGQTIEFLYTSPFLVTVQSIVKYLQSIALNMDTTLKKVATGKAVLLPANIFAQHNKIAWGAKVSAEFKAKVIKICKNLDIAPDHLMTCMAFETGETFRPDKKNGAGSSGTGLIQFMEETAEVFETSTKELAAMTAVRQLDYVEMYFKDALRVYKHLDSLEDVYFAILNPAGIRKKDGVALFKAGTKAYSQNKGLDKNNDKKITVGEVASKIRYMYKKGLQQGYLG